ncbi:MAG: ATP-dependent helicase UvrD/PcrA [Patescibacteria group bacterium]|nr:ATP-dependent helicase UvrD/PcrA [Patescibacteria group bacterium]
MKEIKLNAKQQEAVDQIDGPVMVLAGPGTGKTQLLSARVANILKLTDVNPSNILCLTYTEAGVTAMKERLAQTIGPAGYQVSVHTFHSFALEVMRRFPDYFLDTRGFTAIDELTSYQVLEKILAELPPNFKLAHRSFARENRISDLTSKISELKKAGLSPDEAKELVERNQADLDSLTPLLIEFPHEIPRGKAAGTKLIETLASFLQEQSADIEPNGPIKSLKNIILKELTSAITESLDSGKTSPITAFKNANLEKDPKGNWRFKDVKYNQNLKELAHIYRLYTEEIYQLEKLEFDDMILNLIRAVSNNDELKLNIQEQWQYFLVDEFQDTSFAQLEIVRLLGDNPANGGQPNIMAVGDDDQAIYAFQGASVSNIQSFIDLYPETNLITLEDNYRSNQAIITTSYQTAEFIEERPTGTTVKKLSKKSEHSKDLEVSVTTLTSNQSELSWLVKDIKEQLESGQKPEEIAILAPRHRYLQELALELHASGVPVYYESSSNILEDEIILELLSLSQLVLKIASGDLAHSNSLLAEVISAPYWQLPVGSVWRLSLHARNAEFHKHWLEHLVEGALGEQGKLIATQLLKWSNESSNSTLEQMLDLLIGATQQDEPQSTSPFKAYYFSSERLSSDPAGYANFLSSLTTLRDHLRSYFPDMSSPKLKDLTKYVELCQQHGGIRIARRGLHIKPSGVNLITAYGSKGLEFEQVYIIHSSEDVWSEAARGKVDTLKLTANFASHKDTSDDKTRLFYVAQTRAKNRLVHTLHKFDEKGKQKVLLRYLQPLQELPEVIFTDLSEEQMDAQTSAEAYQQKLFGTEEYTTQEPLLAEILQPILENYRLSATHLTTWLDEKYGGRDEFITRHLLRFPQAMSESAVHGSAVHKALEKAHLAHRAGHELTQADLDYTYAHEIAKCALDDELKEKMLQRSHYLFEKFIDDISDLINTDALPEVDIKTNFEDIRLSGKLDAVIINKKEGSAVVRDYKTGKPGAYIDNHYKNQLYLYKLLLEQSPERLPKEVKLIGAELVYLNPSEEAVVTQKLEYKEDEYQEFKLLLKKVWVEIMSLGTSA